MDSVAQTGAARSSAPRVRLTCEACRQRKVKCDKLSPCSSCQRLGLVCVPVERARLPRGRTRKPTERVISSDKELSERVAKLEKLLKRVASERTGSEEQMPTSVSLAAPVSTASELCSTQPNQDHDWQEDKHVTGSGNAYMPVSFWEDIIQQTQDLRSVLDCRLEIENNESRDSTAVFGTSIVSSEIPESVSNLPATKGVALQPHTQHKLCDAFFHNVDPLFKILHRPSLEAFIKEGQPYLNYEQGHQAPNTLASAVYLAAVCTLDNTECQSLFNTDKKSLVVEFQKESEAALAKADFVTTNDITVLQAYIISLLAARSQGQSRRVWTMLAMALRVGQALSLHTPTPPFKVRPFEHEMRRRAWLGIGLLDVAASLDRASEPMMQAAWLDYHPPSNINDEDIWFEMPELPRQHPKGTFTDMTHTLVIAASASVTRSLAFADLMEPTVKIIGQRKQIVKDFQDKASDLLSGCRPDLSEFQWYAQKAARAIGSWLQLASIRPMQRNRNFTPPKVHGDALLKIAAENLEWSQVAYDHPGAEAWRWYGSMWVPWHVLAVAIAELCVCKDLSIVLKYWGVVDTAYQRSRIVVADSQEEMLWKPMERLMSQAIVRKNELIDSDASQQKLSQQPQYAFSGMSSGLDLHQHQEQPFAGFSLELEEAINQPRNSHIAEVPTSFAPVPWTNVWDAMDLTSSNLQGSSDDNAWLSYETFMNSVYDYEHSPFLPR